MFVIIVSYLYLIFFNFLGHRTNEVKEGKTKKEQTQKRNRKRGKKSEKFHSNVHASHVNRTNKGQFLILQNETKRRRLEEKEKGTRMTRNYAWPP